MNTTDNATRTVLTHHLTAFGNNDLDEIMSDYTEQSIVLTEQGIVKGLESIRQAFEELFRLIPTGSEFAMNQLTISGNAAHIIWSSKSAIAEIPFGSDTFIIENGQINVHTLATFVKQL